MIPCVTPPSVGYTLLAVIGLFVVGIAVVSAWSSR